MTPFWLSHHSPEEFNRTYALGKLRICARCLGTYPTLLLALGVQFSIGAPLALRWDVPFALALTTPALVDWAVGRFRPASGSNGRRTSTGLLLGLALGRSLYIHLHRPMPAALLFQLLLVIAVAGPALLLSRRGTE